MAVKYIYRLAEFKQGGFCLALDAKPDVFKSIFHSAFSMIYLSVPDMLQNDTVKQFYDIKVKLIKVEHLVC